MNTVIFSFFHKFFNKSKPADQVFNFIAKALPYVAGAVVLVFLFVGDFSKGQIALVILAPVCAWLVAFILKNIFHTNRPTPQKMRTLFLSEKNFAFPSEHSAIFAALATVGYFLNPHLGIFLICVALAIGVSRVVVGFHYPFDILGGFSIGLIISLICIHFFLLI